nr:hypothetical protein [uncultured Tyzzerella sp.]
MKKKILILGIIFTFTLTGCFNKKDKDSQTEATTDIATSTSSENNKNTPKDEIEKNKTDISIFTKDTEIPYIKISNNENSFDSNEEKDKIILDFIKAGEDDKLIQLENEENIRIEFPKDLPKDSTVNITKTYVRQDGKGDTENFTENMSVDLNKNGNVDFKHTFDTKDKYLDLVVYEILINWKDISVKYNFAIKIDNITMPNNEPYNVVGYLSEDEQKIYDNYKRDKKIDVFKGVEPLKMVKYYTQAIMEKEFNIAYTLYKDYDTKNMTEEKYIQIMKNLSQDEMKSYIENLKAIVDGEFFEDGKDAGYIQYSFSKDHPMAIDVIKDKDIWKIQYIPIQ